MQFPQLDTILLGTQFVGVELYCYNSEKGVAVLNIEKKQGELIITNREKRSSFDKLVDKPSKDNPVFITINDNQVIHKEIEGNDSADSKILYKAFPNIKQDDFFYQILRLESKSIVAICRKSYVEQLLKELSDLDITVSGITLGVCGIGQVINFIDNQIIKTNSQTITADNEQIFSLSEDALVKTYDVNGLEVQSAYILSFCSVLQELAPSSKASGNIDSINTTLFEAYYQNSFFKKIVRLMIFTLLFILLINFFVFNYYYKKSVESNASVLASKEMINKIKQTKLRLKNKESKLKNVSNLFDSKSSYFVNEITKNIPSSILLNELTYHPLEKNIREDQVIIFQNNVLVISGKTVNTKELTSWFEEIEKKDWVKSTSIVHFGKNETNESVFTIKINLKPNEIK